MSRKWGVWNCSQMSGSEHEKWLLPKLNQIFLQNWSFFVWIGWISHDCPSDFRVKTESGSSLKQAIVCASSSQTYWMHFKIVDSRIFFLLKSAECTYSPFFRVNAVVLDLEFLLKRKFMMNLLRGVWKEQRRGQWETHLIPKMSKDLR